MPLAADVPMAQGAMPGCFSSQVVMAFAAYHERLDAVLGEVVVKW